MPRKAYNVLFLCTGNSARSVMSEALITILGKGRFKGFSAGSKPAGRVNPFAIEQIKAFDPSYPVDDFRSKSRDEFALPDAPHMDFIITVCDSAARETCPCWPGRPATAHWGYEDPHGECDAEKRASFQKVFEQITKRMEAFVALPTESMDANAVRQAAKKSGRFRYDARAALHGTAIISGRLAQTLRAISRSTCHAARAFSDAEHAARLQRTTNRGMEAGLLEPVKRRMFAALSAYSICLALAATTRRKRGATVGETLRIAPPASRSDFQIRSRT